jgi:hypothetical protein
MTPAANIQPSGKDTVNSQTTSKPSTVKVIAQSEKEGMATRFEDAYLRVCKDIKKVKNHENSRREKHLLISICSLAIRDTKGTFSGHTQRRTAKCQNSRAFEGFNYKMGID